MELVFDVMRLMQQLPEVCGGSFEASHKRVDYQFKNSNAWYLLLSNESSLTLIILRTGSHIDGECIIWWYCETRMPCMLYIMVEAVRSYLRVSDRSTVDPLTKKASTLIYWSLNSNLARNHKPRSYLFVFYNSTRVCFIPWDEIVQSGLRLKNVPSKY